MTEASPKVEAIIGAAAIWAAKETAKRPRAIRCADINPNTQLCGEDKVECAVFDNAYA